MAQVLNFFSSALRATTVEPVMLIDGACKEAMLLYSENVQMNKICSVKMGYSDEVCQNLSAYQEENVAVQRELTVFTFYNSIIMSVLPLIYVLFMGAWSDKYGRKIPMVLTLVCRVFYSGGYLLVNWQTRWPVEVLYLMTFLEAVGGGNPGIFSSSFSYISDITKEKDRTSRMSTANSLWYLGGPLGTLLAALLIKEGGYNLPLALVFFTYIGSVIYVVLYISESHGPRAKKELAARGSLQLQTSLPKKKDMQLGTMVKDFFDWHRVLESFKTAFKKREGKVRAVLLVVLAANMVRRLARGFFMYQFARQVLDWDASEYGYWITYRNLLTALGSLFLVPVLTKKLSFTDTSLAVLGCASLVLEYVLYGVTKGKSMEFMMWLGPPASIVSNASTIAFKSMATKLVSKQEKGRVNAVFAAFNGLMPMLGYAAYSPLYYHTVDTFPGAQFFFGASLNVLIMMAFIALGMTESSESYNAEDFEKGADVQKPNIIHGLKRRSSITLKAIVRTFSLPGGKSVVTIPPPQEQQQSPTLHEEEEGKEESDGAAANTQEVTSECYSNAVTDSEMTATETAAEVTPKKDNEGAAAPQVAHASIEATEEQAKGAKC